MVKEKGKNEGRRFSPSEMENLLKRRRSSSISAGSIPLQVGGVSLGGDGGPHEVEEGELTEEDEKEPTVAGGMGLSMRGRWEVCGGEAGGSSVGRESPAAIWGGRTSLGGEGGASVRAEKGVSVRGVGENRTTASNNEKSKTLKKPQKSK